MKGIEMNGKVALITGGTMGIGLATALKFGANGVHTVLTHRWGSADEEDIYRQFEELGAPRPMIVEADVTNKDDTELLLERIGREHTGVDIFISNVAFAQRVNSFKDYSLRNLTKSIEYTAWPMWAYSDAMNKKFGRYPKYIVGLSSDGPDSFFAYYDFVAMSKAVLETMCRYMNFRLRKEGVRVNIIRSRMVPTKSFDATFGKPFHDFAAQLGFDDCYVSVEEIANVILALSSGLLDAVGGQVIMADRGFVFFDSLMGAYERSDAYPTE